MIDDELAVMRQQRRDFDVEMAQKGCDGSNRDVIDSVLDCHHELALNISHGLTFYFVAVAVLIHRKLAKPMTTAGVSHLISFFSMLAAPL